MQMRSCVECGLEHPPEFFRGRLVHKSAKSHASAKCIACEQTAKDEVKFKNRWIDKARTTLYRHAKKFIAAGWAKDLEEFKERFGWTVQRIAHDMEFHYGNGCICDAKFSSMGHGLADITLDIIRPNDPPYYTDNVRFICATCNRGKGKAPPAVFSVRLLCWKKWRARRDKLTTNPMAWSPLWEWADTNAPR